MHHTGERKPVGTPDNGAAALTGNDTVKGGAGGVTLRHSVYSGGRADLAAALRVLETARNLKPANQSIYRDIMALQLRLGDNDAAAATLRLLENQFAEVEEIPDDSTRVLARTIGAHS